MKVGIVTGMIWATRKVKELPGGALLEVEALENGENPEQIIAYDPLGAGIGEHVLVTQGSVAKGWFSSQEKNNVVIDALIIGIVDEKNEN